MWPWIEAGEFKPIVHCSLPAAEAAEAHRVMEASEHIGKIVLEWPYESDSPLLMGRDACSLRRRPSFPGL